MGIVAASNAFSYTKRSPVPAVTTKERKFTLRSSYRKRCFKEREKLRSVQAEAKPESSLFEHVDADEISKPPYAQVE